MLYKHYPPGGGILFKRYYGIGAGILVPRDEIEMMSGVVDVSSWTADRTQASPTALATGQVCTTLSSEGSVCVCMSVWMPTL